MNNNSRHIFTGIIILAVIVASIWLGFGVVAAQNETLIQVVGAAILLSCIFLGQRIWLFYIFLISMQVPLISGLTTREFGQFLFIGFSTLLFLIRKLKTHQKPSELDFWRLAVVAVILQVYIRYPVGLNLFGSSSVGARPYFLAALALFSGFILSRYRVESGEIKWAFRLTIFAYLLSVPLYRFRYGIGAANYIPNSETVAGGIQAEGAKRVSSFGNLSEMLSRIVVSRISPLRASVHPLWAILILFTLALAAASGFRNYVANVGFIFLAGVAYRGGLSSVLVSGLLGTLALGILALVNLAAPLPSNVQRALSPFPGTWEKHAVADAEGSTEWRIQMWKEALISDRWIKNKFLGDGIGFTKEELEWINSLQGNEGGGSVAGSELSVQQENMMVVGNYHSGPIQTIRTVGYLGLLVMLIAMVRMAVLTHREILRCRGTEWFPILLFFGIPIIIYPFFFTLIFGTFGEAVIFIFLQSGFIDLIRKNLPLPPYVKPKRDPYLLKNHRSLNAAQGS